MSSQAFAAGQQRELEQVLCNVEKVVDEKIEQLSSLNNDELRKIREKRLREIRREAEAVILIAVDNKNFQCSFISVPHNFFIANRY